MFETQDLELPCASSLSLKAEDDGGAVKFLVLQGEFGVGTMWVWPLLDAQNWPFDFEAPHCQTPETPCKLP
jgi:hypothetical protein